MSHPEITAYCQETEIFQNSPVHMKEMHGCYGRQTALAGRPSCWKRHPATERVRVHSQSAHAPGAGLLSDLGAHGRQPVNVSLTPMFLSLPLSLKAVKNVLG